MPATPDWETELHNIEFAVGACLTALDQYERAFHTELQTRGVELPKEPLETTGDPRWERALGGANRAAHDVEALLAEQESIWNRWQELLAGWRRSVQQSPVMSPESTPCPISR